MARADVVRYAETVLHDYLDGRERDYAVYDVIQELLAVMGDAAVIPVQLIGLAMDADDEWRRKEYITQALDKLGRRIRGE